MDTYTNNKFIYINNKLDQIIESINLLNAKVDKILKSCEENEDDMHKLKYDIYDLHNKIIGY